MSHISVPRNFVAQGYLAVPGSGPDPEGEVRSYHFRAAVGLAAFELNEYGYLVDRVDVEETLDAVDAVLNDLKERYRDALSNDLSESEVSPSSVEHFVRLFGDRVVDSVKRAG